MAFASASGHTNLPNGNFSPVIYSQKVLKTFRKASVVEDITNTDYTGEIANFGDSVEIIMEPEVTVASYTRGQQLTSQALEDDTITLVVDKANQFQFEVDDIEKKHSHVNFESLASNNAAYKLKDAFDTEVLSYMAGQATTDADLGTTGSPIDLGFDTGEVSPLKLFSIATRIFDLANIPTDNRWAVVDPLFIEQLEDEDSKFISKDYNGGVAPLTNGRVLAEPVRGFKLYKSNNLPGTSIYQGVMFGHMSSTATVSQIAKTESFRSQNSFADVVRGLHLYGRKTLRADALLVGYFNK